MANQTRWTAASVRGDKLRTKEATTDSLLHSSGQYKYLLYFVGKVKRDPREGDLYSHGVRQRVFEHWGASPDFYLRDKCAVDLLLNSAPLNIISTKASCTSLTNSNIMRPLYSHVTPHHIPASRPTTRPSLNIAARPTHSYSASALFMPAHQSYPPGPKQPPPQTPQQA